MIYVLLLFNLANCPSRVDCKNYFSFVWWLSLAPPTRRSLYFLLYLYFRWRNSQRTMFTRVDGSTFREKYDFFFYGWHEARSKACEVHSIFIFQRSNYIQYNERKAIEYSEMRQYILLTDQNCKRCQLAKCQL